MNATARDFNSQPADTNGLEDIFELNGVTSETVLGSLKTVAGPSQDEGPGLSHQSVLLTTLEVADSLGISKRSVIRLIQEGKLAATKAEGRYLIDSESVEQRKRVLPVARRARDEGLGPSQDEGPVPSKDRETVYVSLDIEGPGPTPTQNTNTLDAERLLKDLEAASYRIGYLESKLEERDLAIKLLIDSQHKPSWWSKFASWFLKAQ
jgi:excisionase family DNA binding protein